MASQKVCDGCGTTQLAKDARGDWARVFVPSMDFLALGRNSDHPELDLCPSCFLGVLSLATAFKPLVNE